MVEKLSVVLLLVVIVLYAAAVFIASDRRAAIRNVGIAIVVTGVAITIARQFAVRLPRRQHQNGDRRQVGDQRRGARSARTS